MIDFSQILFSFLVSLCLLFSFDTYGQTSENERLSASNAIQDALSGLDAAALSEGLPIVLNDDSTDPETRFTNAYNLIFYISSPEEAEALALTVVYPFVQKTWKSQSEQLSHLARLYLLAGFCHRERGGDDRDEKERLFVEKALETAKKSEDNAVCARCCTACAFMEIKRGDVKKAHEYLYQAIDCYDKMGAYVKSSEMLYVIVSNFFEIKDTDGMQRVLQQMEEYLEKEASKQSLYQYN